VIEPGTDPVRRQELVTPRALRYHGPMRHVKRVIDVLLVIVALPAVIVIGMIIAVAIRLSSRGPVLFHQVRVGRDGRCFKMVKFRSMQSDAEERLRSDPELLQLYLRNDHKLPANGDPRLTRVGRWLRRTSIDELPQAWNVLTGSMSLVGPRPVTPEQLSDWHGRAATYLSMRPGLTGMWQINGRSGVKADDRLSYDRIYLHEWSLRLDLKILALTPLTVFSTRGAH
jgi:exopolysaccharide production protein ExoY